MKKWCEKLKGNLFFVSQFALDDFKTKYAGSVLGFFWAFVQPVITVLIYWFIFQIEKWRCRRLSIHIMAGIRLIAMVFCK